MISALARMIRRARLRQDEKGSMAIETAFVIPCLLTLALGGFEVSTMVARQTDLQSAAAEAASIVRATVPETQAERDTVRDVLASSTGLDSSQITITEIYRCGIATNYVINSDICGGDIKYKFIRVDLTDSYVPTWTEWGLGSGIDYNISRTVQIG